MQDQEKNFRLQKLTEESIQMQSDILVMGKEKERLQFERDEYERQTKQLESIQEEYKLLMNEK